MTRKMMMLDWRTMKLYHKRLFLFPLIWIVLGISWPLAIIPASVITGLFFSINPFAMEEKGALDSLYLTLPVTRKAIVSGRYALSGAVALCCAILGIPAMLIANQFSLSKYYPSFQGYILIAAVCCFLYALLNLLMFPILFRLGYQKGKFWGFILPVALFGGICGVMVFLIGISEDVYTSGLIDFSINHPFILSGGLMVAAALLLAVSYKLSVWIFSKRDL
jgi:ABC-type transport system involved in multi-copper enzyme maturation permease subunit